MIDWLETFKAVGAIVGPLMGAGGVGTYLAARRKAQTSSPSQIATSQATFGTMLNEQTKILLAENVKDRRDLKRVVARQGKEIARVSAAVEECTTKHIECELKADELRIQVDALMRIAAPPPATYDMLKRQKEL